jgi:hypothetical protein
MFYRSKRWRRGMRSRIQRTNRQYVMTSLSQVEFPVSIRWLLTRHAVICIVFPPFFHHSKQFNSSKVLEHIIHTTHSRRPLLSVSISRSLLDFLAKFLNSLTLPLSGVYNITIPLFPTLHLKDQLAICAYSFHFFLLDDSLNDV